MWEQSFIVCCCHVGHICNRQDSTFFKVYCVHCMKLHSCRKTLEPIKGCMFGAHAWWTLASATLILKMFLDLLINVIVVHRAAIWAWCGWVWQGMGSAAAWIYASCYPACSLVEEPGWGTRCLCTLKKTVGSCNRKWVKIWNVGLQMHQLCTLISENIQLTGLICW